MSFLIGVSWALSLNWENYITCCLFILAHGCNTNCWKGKEINVKKCLQRVMSVYTCKLTTIK